MCVCILPTSLSSTGGISDKPRRAFNSKPGLNGGVGLGLGLGLRLGVRVNPKLPELLNPNPDPNPNPSRVNPSFCWNRTFLLSYCPSKKGSILCLCKALPSTASLAKSPAARLRRDRSFFATEHSYSLPGQTTRVASHAYAIVYLQQRAWLDSPPRACDATGAPSQPNILINWFINKGIPT